MTTQPRGVPRPARRGGEQGFTLVELLIVIVVLGILSGIVVFGVARFRSDAQAAACRADLVTVSVAADAYDAATGGYPATMDALVRDQYLKSAPSGGTFAFDQRAKTVSRDPACADGSGAVPGRGAMVGIGGKCIDVSAADGATVQILSCNGGDRQRWTMPASAPGPITALGKCMAVAGGSTSSYARVQLSTCTGAADQQWTPDGGLVRHPLSGLCLDAEGASTADGTRLIIYPCHGNPNQRWVLP